MKTRLHSHFGLFLLLSASLVMPFSIRSLAATTHVVTFGGSLGFAYSPKSISVSVGDTIQWVGNFGTLPLSSTAIPLGAAAWHNETTNPFSYVVTLPGTYQYQCDNHSSLGMTGSFEAVTTGIDSHQRSATPTAFQLAQNYPNPFNPTTLIRFDVPKPAHVTMKLYDVTGQEVMTLVEGNEQPGQYSVTLDANDLASGVYLYRMQAGSFTQTRKLVLVR